MDLSSTAIVPICGLENAFAANAASALIADMFCACPAAKNILKSMQLQFPVLINNNLEAVHTHFASFKDENDNPRAMVFISLKDEKYPGDSLAFELLNAQKMINGEYGKIVESSTKGHYSIDEFALAMERSKYDVAIAANKMVKKCFPHWKLEPDHKDIAFEESLWYEEVSCEADHYRIQWLDHSQKNYCNEHPDDKHSCEATAASFCDLRQIMKWPKDKIQQFMRERMRTKIDSAPQKIKDTFAKESSFVVNVWLTALITTIAALPALFRFCRHEN